MREVQGLGFKGVEEFRLCTLWVEVQSVDGVTTPPLPFMVRVLQKRASFSERDLVLVIL